jgi:hypothetical protein
MYVFPHSSQLKELQIRKKILMLALQIAGQTVRTCSGENYAGRGCRSERIEHPVGEPGSIRRVAW